MRTREAADVACPLAHCELEAKANTKEGDLLLACPLDGEHHTLRTADAEATWHEDTATDGVNREASSAWRKMRNALCRDHRLPRIVVFCGVRGLSVGFQVSSRYPLRNYR